MCIRDRSQAMFHESRLAKENAKKVPSNINPKIPAVLMVSNGDGTSFSQSEWQRYAERFASNQSNEMWIRDRLLTMNWQKTSTKKLKLLTN